MRTFQKAFVLVSTLWILAVLTIAASFFALWTQRTVAVVQANQEDVQGELDMLNTQASLIYLLTTQRMTIAGLTLPEDETTEEQEELDKKNDFWGQDSILSQGGELAIDDRPYFGYGKAYFALQDEAGLLGINLATEPILARLLGLLGVDEALHDPLIAKLQDYIDTDDLHRLNGAEAYHYEKQGLRPPSNRYLINPMEIKRILDWSEQASLWENDRLGQLTNTVLAALPNFNTAPSLVLQAVFNMTAQGAERIIQIRQTIPFYNLNTINEIGALNLTLDPIDLNFFPSFYFRLTLWYEGGKRMRQVHVQLTHRADGFKPWKIQYTLEQPLLSTYEQTPPNRTGVTLF
jgi:general secretion pathway protein K